MGTEMSVCGGGQVVLLDTHYFAKKSVIEVRCL